MFELSVLWSKLTRTPIRPARALTEWVDAGSVGDASGRRGDRSLLLGDRHLGIPCADELLQRGGDFRTLNIHLLHDAGAFQVGLGLAMMVPVALHTPLRAPLIAVLGASVLHVLAHVEDIRLGGHPTTDLPVLTLICIALAGALVVEMTARRA